MNVTDVTSNGDLRFHYPVNQTFSIENNMMIFIPPSASQSLYVIIHMPMSYKFQSIHVDTDNKVIYIDILRMSLTFFIAIYILWNHFNSWMTLFVDCQKFAGSWGHTFMGNRFVVFECKTIYFFVKRSLGNNSLIRVPYEMHEY